MSVNAPVQNGSSTGKPTANPSEVGWLFVPQYYTFLNNDPSKLHCFYSKRSTLTHGAEQEEVPLCIGQQQIHEKIVSLGFSDAKVYVSNVDSQASMQGGIIIQVLGEMSNKGGSWRKFAQTFFLAEQPNGYFVLNDIFRYLKEDDEVEEEARDVDSALQTELQDATSRGNDAVHQVELRQDQAQPIQDASISTAPSDPVSAAQQEGDFKAQEPTPAEPSEVGVDKKVTAVEPDQIAALTKGQEQASQAAAEPVENTSAPTPAINGNHSAPAAAAPPAAPAGPKTWANLAASNATKWGSTVSAEVRGVSSAQPQTQAAPTNRAAAVASSQSSFAARGAAAGGNGHVFIKNVVVENLPSEGLQAALEAKYGPMKECTVVASKACAFGEFASSEAAKKAIQASLPTSQGGEGGVKIGKNGWTVIVEEKRKPNAASGAPNAQRGGGRGGARGGQRGGFTAGGRGGRGGAAQ